MLWRIQEKKTDYISVGSDNNTMMDVMNVYSVRMHPNVHNNPDRIVVDSVHVDAIHRLMFQLMLGNNMKHPSQSVWMLVCVKMSYHQVSANVSYLGASTNQAKSLAYTQYIPA